MRFRPTAAAAPSGEADRRPLRAFAWGYALLMAGLAIAGAVRAFTPVPYTDSWPGIVGFYARVLDGDWFAWLELFNQHPNTIARLFYFADMRWFGGAGASLLAVNDAIAAGAGVALCAFFREADEAHEPDAARSTLYGFVFGSAFYWCQWENLTWGFQVTFLLGHALPLCAFLFLHLSAKPRAPHRRFLLACLFAAACVGTMGNGILVPPLMTVAVLASRQPRRRAFVLAILSVVMTALYFTLWRWTTANQYLVHNSMSLTDLLGNLGGLCVYFLSFLGGPFSYVVGRGNVGRAAALIAGAAFAAACCVELYRCRRGVTTLRASLLGVIAFTTISGLGVTLNRFGICHPTDSRYTTTALIGWLALLCLNAPAVLAAVRRPGRARAAALCVLPLAMLAGQTSALRSHAKDIQFDKVRAVGMALGVDLRPSVDSINPWIEAANAARARHLTIFGRYPYRNMVDEFGKPLARPQAVPAAGGLDTVDVVATDRRFVHVAGWIADPASHGVPRLVRCVGPDGAVVGFAITGSPCPPQAGQANHAACGFGGYMLSSAIGSAVSFVGDDPACGFRAIVTPR